MKNSWKQFEGWVTELKNDPFTGARIKLTIFDTTAIVLVFLIINFILKYVDSGMVPEYYGFNQWTIDLYLLIIVGVVLADLFIGAKTLAPILNIMKAQKRFVADASHELRTPLAIIKTNSEITLMAGDHIDPKEAKETLTSNIEEINRMSKIIENLLSLSYYASEAGEIKLEEIDVSKLVVETVEKIKSLAKNKSIDLKITNTDTCTIFGNPVAIEQVVINLIKNSVAYTPPKGWVSISVTARNSIIQKLNVVELEIKDNGIGIDEADLPHVFHPFYKTNRVRNPLVPESSGLGLTIVKKIVERHKGLISISSTLGKGTSIIITFPRYRPD